MAALEFELDHPRRIVLVRAIGEVDGRTMLARLPAFWRENPQIATWHSISDMSRFTGDLRYDDIRAISHAWQDFCQGRDSGTYTAVVSFDPVAWMFVNAIMLVFPARRFAVFRSVEAARQWIPAPI